MRAANPDKESGRWASPLSPAEERGLATDDQGAWGSKQEPHALANPSRHCRNSHTLCMTNSLPSVSSQTLSPQAL